MIKLTESRIDLKTRIRNLEMIYRNNLLNSSDQVIVERLLGELKGKLRYTRYESIKQ